MALRVKALQSKTCSNLPLFVCVMITCPQGATGDKQRQTLTNTTYIIVRLRSASTHTHTNSDGWVVRKWQWEVWRVAETKRRREIKISSPESEQHLVPARPQPLARQPPCTQHNTEWKTHKAAIIRAESLSCSILKVTRSCTHPDGRLFVVATTLYSRWGDVCTGG